MNSEMLFNAGAFLFGLCAIPNLYAILRNRNVLKGYSFWGSLGTLLAILCFTLAYVPLGYWWSVLFNIPGLIQWSAATVYTWRSSR